MGVCVCVRAGWCECVRVGVGVSWFRCLGSSLPNTQLCLECGMWPDETSPRPCAGLSVHLLASDRFTLMCFCVCVHAPVPVCQAMADAVYKAIIHATPMPLGSE